MLFLNVNGMDICYKCVPKRTAHVCVFLCLHGLPIGKVTSVFCYPLLLLQKPLFIHYHFCFWLLLFCLYIVPVVVFSIYCKIPYVKFLNIVRCLNSLLNVTHSYTVKQNGRQIHIFEFWYSLYSHHIPSLGFENQFRAIKFLMRPEYRQRTD